MSKLLLIAACLVGLPSIASADWRPYNRYNNDYFDGYNDGYYSSRTRYYPEHNLAVVQRRNGYSTYPIIQYGAPQFNYVFQNNGQVDPVGSGITRNLRFGERLPW